MLDFSFLKGMLKKLTAPEIKLLKRSISIKHPEQVSLGRNLCLELLNIVLKFPAISSEEVEKILYSKSNRDAFNKIVIKLIEVTLDIVMLKESIVANDNYDKRSKEVYLIIKAFLQFDLLFPRGAIINPLQFIERIIKKSIQYESYDILLMALNKKQILLFARNERLEINKLKLRIQFYEDCRISYYKAFEYFNHCGRHFFSKILEMQFKNKLPSIINEVELDLIRTKSNHINYYLFYLKYTNFNFNNDHINKIRVLSELINFLNNQKLLSTPFKKGSAYLNLANAYLDLYEFEEAINSSKIALRYFNNLVESTSSAADELLFLSNYYIGNLSKATQQVDLIITKYEFQKTYVQVLMQRCKYYFAAIHFINQDFSKSFQILNLLNILEKDKDRWNVAIRILLILSQIELENFDLADNLIDNLRKHIFTNTKGKIISERDQLITKILVSLSLQSYNFKKTFTLKKSMFELLESPVSGESHWKIKSQEMIVFQEWFYSKMKLIPYDHAQVMGKMKRQLAPPH